LRGGAGCTIAREGRELEMRAISKESGGIYEKARCFETLKRDLGKGV